MRWILGLHAVVVTALIVAFKCYPVTHGDMDWGVVVAGLPLLILGMPWSWHFVADTYAYDDAPDLLRDLVMLGPAVLNVLLHAAILWAVTRIRHARAGVAP